MMIVIREDKIWIWELDDWPDFSCDKSIIEPKLREVRLHQGILLVKISSQHISQK